MCSKKAVTTATRVVVGGVTMGTSELARLAPANTFVGGVARAPENLAVNTVNAGAMLLGQKPPFMPDVPKPEDVGAPAPGSGDEPPKPNQSGPASTTIAGDIAKRRKKLSALQAGLLSTIGTGPGGAAGTPILNTPSATGFKLRVGGDVVRGKLGQ